MTSNFEKFMGACIAGIAGRPPAIPERYSRTSEQAWDRIRAAKEKRHRRQLRNLRLVGVA